MPYSDMAVEDMILLSAEFVGRGIPIPDEIRTTLGPNLIGDIENPETITNANHKYERPSHKP